MTLVWVELTPKLATTPSLHYPSVSSFATTEPAWLSKWRRKKAMETRSCTRSQGTQYTILLMLKGNKLDLTRRSRHIHPPGRRNNILWETEMGASRLRFSPRLWSGPQCLEALDGFELQHPSSLAPTASGHRNSLAKSPSPPAPNLSNPGCSPSFQNFSFTKAS